jgi:hypothetical protein
VHDALEEQLETITVGPDEAGMRLDRWFSTHYLRM